MDETVDDACLSLRTIEGKLSLCHPEFQPICVDFQDKALAYRHSHGGNGEFIVKACMAHKHATIIDTTAGLGRDAYILACEGGQVTMVERSPWMHALLEDGLARLDQTLSLSLVQANSIDYLSSLSKEHYPDVIYVDPMHPPRRKSSLVKKEMRILRSLVGDDLDKEQLLKVALEVALKRVVVKWPTKYPAIIERKPTFSYFGKAVRFDVYQKGVG